MLAGGSVDAELPTTAQKRVRLLRIVTMAAVLPSTAAIAPVVTAVCRAMSHSVAPVACPTALSSEGWVTYVRRPAAQTTRGSYGQTSLSRASRIPPAAVHSALAPETSLTSTTIVVDVDVDVDVDDNCGGRCGDGSWTGAVTRSGRWRGRM